MSRSQYRLEDVVCSPASASRPRTIPQASRLSAEVQVQSLHTETQLQPSARKQTSSQSASASGPESKSHHERILATAEGTNGLNGPFSSSDARPGQQDAGMAGVICKGRLVSWTPGQAGGA